MFLKLQLKCKFHLGEGDWGLGFNFSFIFFCPSILRVTRNLGLVNAMWLFMVGATANKLANK